MQYAKCMCKREKHSNNRSNNCSALINTIWYLNCDAKSRAAPDGDKCACELISVLDKCAQRVLSAPTHSENGIKKKLCSWSLRHVWNVCVWVCVSSGVTVAAPLCNKSLCLWMFCVSGIGRATALALARCGAEVTAVTRTQADLNSLVEEVCPPLTHTNTFERPLSTTSDPPTPLIYLSHCALTPFLHLSSSKMSASLIATLLCSSSITPLQLHLKSNALMNYLWSTCSNLINLHCQTWMLMLATSDLTISDLRWMCQEAILCSLLIIFLIVNSKAVCKECM